MEDPVHDIDKVLTSLGVGRWQTVQFIVFLLFHAAWVTQILSFLILGFVPDFACLPPNSTEFPPDERQNLTYGQTCLWYNNSTNISAVCSGEYVYAEPKEASIVSEWDLVCGSTFLSELSLTIFTAGRCLGTFIFTPISDRYGRRQVVVWCHVALLIVSLLNSLVPNITLFTIVRFCVGALLSGVSLVYWVVMMELFAPQHRTMAALIANVAWSVSACVTPALGYLMKGLSWRYVQLAVSSLSAIIIGQFLFMDEPIRWLMAKGRQKDAIKVVRKAARINGVNPETLSALITGRLSDDNVSESPDGDKLKATGEGKTRKAEPCAMIEGIGNNNNKTTVVPALALINHPKTRRITVVMLLAWFTNSLTYFALYMLSSTMSGDRYLNLFLSAVVEIPATLLLFPIVLKCNRRKALILLHLFSGISLIAAAVLHVTTDGYAGYVAVTCAVLVGKFAIIGAFSLVFMYTPEVYPTDIRSLGVGVAFVGGRVGALLSPFAATVARAVPWLPAAVCGGLCLLITLLCPLLPETRGKHLPQTLADLDRLFSDNSKSDRENRLKCQDVLPVSSGNNTLTYD